MAGLTVRCFYCGEPVDPQARTTWRRVTGWERKAAASSRRGGSDIALRQPLQEWACMHCVDRLQNGVNAAQLELT
jgi:hypothetical protein